MFIRLKRDKKTVICDGFSLWFDSKTRYNFLTLKIYHGIMIVEVRTQVQIPALVQNLEFNESIKIITKND